MKKIINISITCSNFFKNRIHSEEELLNIAINKLIEESYIIEGL
jgi:hypothetical protein